MRSWRTYGRHALAFLLVLATGVVAWQTHRCPESSAIASWVQAAALLATLVYLINYVASTGGIAEATQGQLAIAQEPVVVFDLVAKENGHNTHPTLTNVSLNHARCRVKMEIKVKGVSRPMGATWDGTWHGTDKGFWPVQARRKRRAWFPTASIVGSEAEFRKLLDEQRESWNKTGRDDYDQITATVDVECQRLDGVGRTKPSGPFRYYFLARTMQWVPDFPWPRQESAN